MGGLALLAWAMRAALMLIYPSGQFATHLFMPFRMDTLALGVVVAWATREQPAHEIICSFYARHRWAILSFVGAAVILLCNLSLVHLNSGSPALCLYGYALIAGICAILGALVADVRPSALLRILSVRPHTHLGRHSYFIYLFHPIIGLSIIRFFGGDGLTLDSYNGIAIIVFAVGTTWGQRRYHGDGSRGHLLGWGIACRIEAMAVLERLSIC
jgi:peptidoglycan/LPS O-acetylase OafA/YrhL